MLTRLKVSGFKNLVNVDVSFGPFTCIAGANGVGKSNLFDAIRFLSALADLPLLEAALRVRDGERTADIRSLFHRVGNEYAKIMEFEAEMLVPEEGVDDLGQKAKATITFLCYKLQLAYRQDDSLRSLGGLEILKEELTYITKGEAHKHLPFNSSKAWRDSVLRGAKRSLYFISTTQEDNDQSIILHQDGGSRGRGKASAANLPRTVLSATNASESPTAFLAREEMRSWRLLQLEPSALRRPDEFTAPSHLSQNGLHLAATLYKLARSGNGSGEEHEQKIYAQIANRLSELITDVYAVGIDRDMQRELLTLHVTERDATPHPARSLSDGTLRFLALTVLELDPEAKGVICLEEPENGIHPARIQAMLQLLQDIATDTNEPVQTDNPLRQVIVNTHSPIVVQNVPDDSILFAKLREEMQKGKRFKHFSFNCLPETWRSKAGEHVVAKGDVLAYLTHNGRLPSELNVSGANVRRVIENPEIQQLQLLLFS